MEGGKEGGAGKEMGEGKRKEGKAERKGGDTKGKESRENRNKFQSRKTSTGESNAICQGTIEAVISIKQAVDDIQSKKNNEDMDKSGYNPSVWKLKTVQHSPDWWFPPFW